MCELFGFSSGKQKNLTPYLKEFFSHSINHPNGWGIGELDQNPAHIFTEPVSANLSPTLPSLLENLGEQRHFLAHIRRATVGGIALDNCHPFVRTDQTGRTWVFMHNGTIFSGLELIPYHEKQVGTTDSERILLYLIDQINEATDKAGPPLNSFERFKVVERIVSELSYRNKLNLLIYDGSQMYVHVNMKDTLYIKSDGESALFATTPLYDEGWEPLPLTTLLVYQDGVLKYRGKNHHNEYTDIIDTSQKFDYNI